MFDPVCISSTDFHISLYGYFKRSPGNPSIAPGLWESTLLNSMCANSRTHGAAHVSRDEYLITREGKASLNECAGLTTFAQVVRKTTSGAVEAAPSKCLQGATVVQPSSIGFRADLQYLLGLCPRAPPRSSPVRVPSTVLAMSARKNTLTQALPGLLGVF